MAPREPWERVWIDAETYASDVHSLINCTQCHAGQAVDDMTLAHDGLIERPAVEAVETCGECHPDVAPDSMGSLHTDLAGYDAAIYARSSPELHDEIETVESFHCNNCHATCGDCHVSQPNSVGGGLLEGHVFVETPPMSGTCTACHGSRVQNEYYGLNEGYPSDVHFRERMSCVACHTGEEMHGEDMEAVAHRYDGEAEPSCISCHEGQVGAGSGIEQHEIHGTETLSCQGCHSVAYTSCVNCHVERTDEGTPFYSVEEHSMTFYLGLNPLRSWERPYEYVTLRHVPVDVDSFSFYGASLLPNFDSRPTWVYSTPHNIQRITPQNSACENCHTNDAIWLTRDAVVEDEWTANLGVMVDGAPPLPEGYVPPVSTDEAPAGGDDFWGGGDTAPPPTQSAEGDFWGGDTTTSPTPAPSSDDAFWGSSDETPTQPPSEATPEPESEDAFWGS